MRRELSRLSTSLELFIRLPYSRSSKASNPCLPRWRTDSEADRRVGCKAVQMLTRWAWRSISHLQRFQRRYQREAAKQRAAGARRNPNSHESVTSGSPPKSALHTAHNTILVFLSSDSPGSLNGTLCFLSTCGDRSVRVNLHRTSSPAVYKQIQEEFM